MSEQEKYTADNVVSYLQHGGFESRIDGQRSAPWTFIEEMNGETLAKWFRVAKVNRDLIALAKSNPEQHRIVIQGKENEQALSCAFEEVWRSLPDKSHERWQVASNQHRQENAELYKAVSAWQAFKQQSEFSFMARGIAHRDDWVYDIGMTGMHYGLFQNTETGDFIATMRDSRRSISKRVEKVIVTSQTIVADGQALVEIQDQARWFAAEVLTSQLRYFPITIREHVEAMVEADRVREHWKANEASVTKARGSSDIVTAGEPTLPNRGLFDFFPAFRRAYGGKEGFLHAIMDYCGPKGNVLYCYEQGVRHSDWGGYRSGAEIAEEFEIPERSFISMFEQMNSKDRRDFRAALKTFITEVLPYMGTSAEDEDKRYSIVDQTASALCTIKVAVDHGSGALKSAQSGDLVLGTAEELTAIGMNKPKRSALRRRACRPVYAADN